ncbi:MAG: tetratricopeptide repeat protein, partial [Anaerolineales bacterium]|nr:tetratricopeptide repeat protein [Anaerolineales bacterium]
GVGKSRLVLEFRAAIAAQAGGGDTAVYEGCGLAYARARPYWMMADILRSMIDVVESEPPAQQLDGLAAYLHKLGLWQADVWPYLAHLLGLNHADAPAAERLRQLDAGMLQKLTYAALRRVLLAEARVNPAVLVFEDLHWVDPTSWEFLKYLVQGTANVPLLLLLVSRGHDPAVLEELRSAIEHGPIPFTHVPLQVLTPNEGQQLVERLLQQTDAEAAALKRRIAQRAGGNPFYTEEIVRILIDGGGLVRRDGVWHAGADAVRLLRQVPDTLRGLILARFDSLSAATRQTLQKAAVLGTSFPVALLRALNGASAAQVAAHLREAVQRQFLLPQKVGTETGFAFRHALIQDAIYGTLLHRDRRILHERAARAIENSAHWTPDEKVALLAYHYPRSARRDEALNYLLVAAENAARRYANETAVEHYRETLRLLGSSEERNPVYFRAKIGLGQSLKLLGKFNQARELLSAALHEFLPWSIMADTDDLLPLLVGGLRELADVYLREGAYDEAISHLEAGIESLGGGGREQHPALWLTLIERLAFVHLRQGNLDAAFALAHMGTTEVDLSTVPDPVSVANLYNTLGGITWQQGHTEEAIFYVEQSLDPYKQLGYVWGMANAYSNLGVLHAQQGSWQKTIAYWERALNLRREFGDVHSQAVSLANLGQLRLHMGEHAQAQRDLTQSLATFERVGDSWGMAQAHSTLAQLALVQAQAPVALRHVQQALAIADEIGSQDIQAHGRSILALAQAETGDVAQGMETAVQGIELAKSLGLSDKEADNLRALGILCARSGDMLEAETRLRESAELCRQINDPYRHGLALVELGRLYQGFAGQTDADARTNWPDKAQQVLLEAAALFEGLGARHDLDRARSLLAWQAAPAAPAPRAAPDAEHRRAVILWLRLEAPRHVAADEEAMFELIATVLPPLATIVEAHQGHVRQHTGGLEAVFGAPMAHEDDAERAVLAAYHMMQYVAELGTAAEPALTAQIGIDQGLVVAGRLAHRQVAGFIVTGGPLRALQRLAAQAPHGRIWVTESIFEVTKRLFAYQPAPRRENEERVWQVVGLQREPAPRRGLPDRPARFIGRDAPLRQMLLLTQNCREGLGGLLLIEGEAGIGKSRLMREFRTAVTSLDYTVWSGTCLVQRVNHAFYLFSDLLTQLFQLQPADTPEEMRLKIEQGMLLWPRDAKQVRPYLEMLVGLRPAGPDGERLDSLAPDQLRQQTFVAIRRLLKTMAKRQPIVVMLDDLHWIDPISAELLLFIATIVTTDPIIFVVAQRRQGADLPNDRLIRLQSLLPGQTVQLLLQRLSPGDSQTLLQDLFASPKLPARLSDLIIERSEGNPYFIEEFVRMFIERGYVEQVGEAWQLARQVELAQIDLPASLEALIRARVDALPPELKEVLQCAAIIGREFEAVLVARIAGVEDARPQLGRLASRLMVQHNRADDRWAFSHALFESIVYDMMLKTRRQHLHRQTADFLEQRWAGHEAEHAEVLSYHFTRAGVPEKAVAYLVLAGERAASRYANEEALSYFQTAGDLLGSLPGGDAAWRLRIAVGLGDVYRFVGRYEASLSVLSAALTLMQRENLPMVRLADLHWRMGQTAQAQGEYEAARGYYATAQTAIGTPQTPEQQMVMARALTGLAWAYYAQGRAEEAREACEKSLALAQTVEGISELATAENLLGGIYYLLGEWRPALNHTTRAMVLRDQMGYTWGVAATLSNMGILAVYAGHWHKALAFFKRSLDLRREMGDVEGVAITHNNLGNLYKDQGEAAEAEYHFRESSKLAQLFKMGFHIASAYEGLAQVFLIRGELAAAENMLHEGIVQAEAIGLQDLLADMYRVWAEILLAQRQYDAALEKAKASTRLAVTVGNRSYEVAGWRVASTICLEQGKLAEAEACITRAREALAHTKHELEAAQVAAQAGRIYLQTGQAQRAEVELRTARNVFLRLGAKHLLSKLTEAGSG